MSYLLLCSKQGNGPFSLPRFALTSTFVDDFGEAFGEAFQDQLNHYFMEPLTQLKDNSRMASKPSQSSETPSYMRATTSSLKKQDSTPILKRSDSARKSSLRKERPNSCSKSLQKSSTPSSNMKNRRNDMDISGLSAITGVVPTPKVSNRQGPALKAPPKQVAHEIGKLKVRKSMAVMDSTFRVSARVPLKTVTSTVDKKQQEIQEDIMRAKLLMSLYLKEEMEKNGKKMMKKAHDDALFLLVVDQELSKDIQEMKAEKEKIDGMMDSSQILKSYKEKLTTLLTVKQEIESKLEEIKNEVEKRLSVVLFVDQPKDSQEVCRRLIVKLEEVAAQQERDKTKHFIAAADSSLHLIKMIQEIKDNLKESEENAKKFQETREELRKYKKALNRYQ